MTTRYILCEGPDDIAALREIAQVLGWAKSPPASGRGAGQARQANLEAGSARITVSAPSKASGATGEGKSALARSVADNLGALRKELSAADEAYVSLLAVVFDPDDEPVSRFHDNVVRAIRDHAREWTLSETGHAGVWRALRGAGEDVEIRAVHWRAPGEVLDGLPDHTNLERLLCAVLAKAYPEDKEHVARWLTEIRERQQAAKRKPAGWKAAIHVWLAAVYEKADESSAPARILHQQRECRPHVEPTLAEAGLLDDLRPLLGPP